MIRLIITVLLFTSLLFSQQKSIHQLDSEAFGIISEEGQEINSSEEIMPLQLRKTNSTSVVFGYLPDWEYSNASYLKYDIITHLAAFDFVVDATGSFTKPSGWPWTTIINNAHAKGTKIIMTIVGFDTTVTTKLITNSTAKNALFNNIKNTITSYKLDGVNIDFEGMRQWIRGSILNKFMKELTDYLHTQIPGTEVSFAGPAVNWGGWDLLGLSNSCDYIFIMTYDYYGSWSSVQGPTSPIVNSGSGISVTKSLNLDYSAVISANPHKLILGMPYFGTKYNTFTSSPTSKVRKWIGSSRAKDYLAYADTNLVQFYSPFQSPYYSTKVNDTTYTLNWFDDSTSLSKKVELAKSRNLLGVGMWALAYDGNRQEYWNILRQPVAQVENEIAESFDFKLNQNYPNPFNPTTKISFTLPYTTNIQIEVYDVLGNKLNTILNGEAKAGYNEFQFNGENLASGIYFYTLKADNIIATKKMILVK